MKKGDAEIIENIDKQYERELRDFQEYWWFGPRFDYHPLVGYVNSPTQLPTLNINSLGFRGPEYHTRNIHGSPRIAVFGSSCVVGIPNSNDEKTITAFAQQWLDTQNFDAEILNFGVISARISNEIRLISKFLVEYDIDVVVLVSGFNDGVGFTLGSLWQYEDVADIQLAGFENNRHHNKPSYFLKLAMVAAKRKKFINKAKKASKTPQGVESFFRRKPSKLIEQAQTASVFRQGDNFYKQCLVQIIAACDYSDKPFIYIPQPSLFTTNKTLTIYEQAAMRTRHNIFRGQRDIQTGHIESFVNFYLTFAKSNLALVEERNGTVIDADVEFASAPEGADIFYDESHYLQQGNQLIGEAIAKAAVEKLS